MHARRGFWWIATGLLALPLILGSSGPDPSSAQETGEFSTGHGICPEELEARSGALPLIIGGIESEVASDVPGYQFAVGCRWNDGGFRSVSVAITWTEDPIVFRHAACENPGETVEISRGQAVFADGVQAGVTWVTGNTRVEDEVVAELSSRWLRALDDFALSCDVAPLDAGPWPTCPQIDTVTLEKVQGPQAVPVESPEEDRRVTEEPGLASRDLTCRYRFDDDGLRRLLTVTAYWWLVGMDKPSADKLNWEHCEESGQESRWMDVNAYVSIPTGQDFPDHDKLWESMASQVREYAHPCTRPPDPQAALDALLGDDPLLVEGFVAATGPRGRFTDLVGARIDVTMEGPSSVKTTFTHVGLDGAYNVTMTRPSDAVTYTLTITLADESGTILVKDGRDPDPTPLQVHTLPRSIDEGVVRDRFLIANAIIGTDDLAMEARIQSDSAAAPAVLPATDAHEAAWAYANLMRAELFRALHMPFEMDDELPVETILWEPSEPGEPDAFYVGDDTSIHLQRSATAFNGSHHPESFYAHEYGHHVFKDSRLIHDNEQFSHNAGDTSHGGVDNFDSQDSLGEGWADWFAAAVRGDGRYAFENTLYDLEAGHFDKNHGEPFEEFDFAALLHDLVDDTNEPGDHFSLGVNGLWDVLVRENTLGFSTVRGMFDHLEPVLGSQDSDPDDGLTDLEAVFVLNRFYSDQNGNGEHDPGEPVGYADYWQSTAAHDPDSIRWVPPEPVATGITVDLRDPSGAPVEVNAFEVTTRHDEPVLDRIEFVAPHPETGLLHLLPSSRAEAITVQPLAPGYAIDPWTFNASDFRAARAAADPDDAQRALPFSHQDEARPAAIAAPTGLEAVARADGIHLSWEPLPDGSSPILVRSASGPPQSPVDGEIMGPVDEASHVDGDDRTGVTYHYALFAREGDGTLSPPAHANGTGVRAATGEQQEAPEAGGGWFIWALLATLALIGGVTLTFALMMPGALRKSR